MGDREVQKCCVVVGKPKLKVGGGGFKKNMVAEMKYQDGQKNE